MADNKTGKLTPYELRDFLSDIKKLVRGKCLLSATGKPMFGGVMPKFQDGEWYVFDIRHTEKVD